MLNDGKIQLGSLNHSIDWQAASRSIRTLAGRVIVEMLPETRSVGSILIPETVGGNLRPDIGVVISAPSAVGGKWLPDLPGKLGRDIEAVGYPPVGAIVLVRPSSGTWIEKAEMGTYRPENQVRVYGVYCAFAGTPIREAWWSAIVCGIAGGAWESLEAAMRPFGNNLLLRVDDPIEEEGAIVLSDGDKYRTGLATVIAVGKLVRDVAPGDRVAVNFRALKAFAGLEFDFSDEVKGLWLCTEEAISWIEEKAA